MADSVKALLHYALFHWQILFSLRFSFFLAFFLAFLIPTRGKTREKQDKIAQREKKQEKMFLYYTTPWVKTRASCVFLAILLMNLSETQT